MLLDLINQYKDQYKVFLTAEPDNYEVYHWRSLRTFQDNWNLEADDCRIMFERSFANTLSNALWEGQSYYPKKAMLAFIDRDSDLIRTMFKELFNENLDIEGRIDRFIYHCDEISRDIMRTNPRYQSHYHEGYRMVSVYLAFRYPMQYTVYEEAAYKLFMANIKAKAVPVTGDIERFFKVMRTVYSIISKDEELLELHQVFRSSRNDVYQGQSLMLVHDFYRFSAQANT